jgi:phosphatidylserine/phosphatidylglycerophosphate/cardiolipin synthase-like enzyme
LSLVRADADTVTFWPTMSPKGIIPDSTLWDERMIVDLIDGARRDLYCQVLTYSPVGRDRSSYRVLGDALQRAASRGVRVHMIVADWSKDHPTVDSLKSLSRTPNIEIKFSSIPDYSGGYVSFARVEHCKYLVVDSSACWLGTSNWEKSYFYSTRNLGVVIRNVPIASMLRRVFLKGWDGPYTELIRSDANYAPRMHGER